MDRASELCHLSISILQYFLHSLELSDDVLVDLSLLIHEVLQLCKKEEPNLEWTNLH
jgi:hypothetical protein